MEAQLPRKVLSRGGHKREHSQSTLDDSLKKKLK